MTDWNNIEVEMINAQKRVEGSPHFYFEAQTGRIDKEPPKVSNFYNYKLPGFMLAFVVEGVINSKLDACYLSYPKDFLLELEDWNIED